MTRRESTAASESVANTASTSARDGEEAPPEFDEETMLRVRNLHTRFFTSAGQVNAVENLDFSVNRGEVFGIVGESGSGKSVAGLSILDLVDSPGRITDGEIWYRNAALADRYRERLPEAVHDEFVDVLRLPLRERRALRGNSFSMVFQDPMSSFDPTMTVGRQIAEAVEVQRRAEANPRSTRARTKGYGLGSMVLGSVLPSKRYITPPSLDRAVELLEMVGMPDPETRAREYPHQFSGGMLQRAMIAQALAGEPDLLIADEPTTALDVTIQAQILKLLKELQAEQDMSVVLITHNLGVIARVADQVGVMYAGEIVERGSLEDVFENHVHPYTAGLLGSIPDLDSTEELTPIAGNIPSLLDEEMGDRCYFVDRCPYAMERCTRKPPEHHVTDRHTARCVLAAEPYDESQALTNGRGGRGGGDAA